MSLTLDSVMGALRGVRGLPLGTVKDLKIEHDWVSLKINLTGAKPDAAQEIELRTRQALTNAGAARVDLQVEGKTANANTAANATASNKSSADWTKHSVPGIRHIIAVSSGKGGVGKSTVATNLALALRKLGHRVGLMDSDIYGPNVPTMMGSQEPPMARHDAQRGELILPPEVHGVKIMSMGVLTPGDQPTVWRGPMLHSIVSQFLMKVDWGTLDYLVIDMPPGTGDVQLSLTQLVALDGAVVVTTPQEVAMQDVRKAIMMFEKVGVPILGVVENMSYFVCDECDKKHYIFGKDGADKLAEKFNVSVLAKLPLHPEVREGGDIGTPITALNPEGVHAKAFIELAKTVVAAVEKSASGELEISGF